MLISIAASAGEFMQNSAVIALLAYAVVAHAASYTTYIGDANPYQVSAIATDAGGNAYITGSRAIQPASLNPSYSSVVTDVFVSKLDPSGNLTVIGTFSGKGTDQANGIAVDPSGNVYIVGSTTSTDFPLHNPLQSLVYTLGSGIANGTGFLMKLSADGTVLYSTYLGGTAGYSTLSGVAADSNGNAYVTGTTTAKDYPHTSGMPADGVSNGPIEEVSGAFFAKIDPAGRQILYAGALTAPVPGCEEGGAEGSSCFLSSVYTSGTAIAVDPAGNAYIAGNAGGGGLSTTPGALLTTGIGAFVAKVNFAGTGLIYVTYLGGGNLEPGVGTVATDFVYAIAANSAGNAYITGSTSDPAFPATKGAFQTVLAGQVASPFVGLTDAFVAKLNPTGSAMVWATFLGGTGADAAQTIATDAAGNVWVSGATQSTDFPTTVSVAPRGSEFLAELNSTGSTLSYAALFPSNTVAQALAVDASGMVHIGGANGLISAFPAGSAPGQTSAPWMSGIANAAGGVLSGRLAPGELISLYGLHLGPVAPISATFNAAGFLPTTLGAVQITVNGIPAPLLYVSDTQINAVVPVELTAGSSAELELARNGVPVQDFRVQVDIVAPQVFRNPNGSAAAINQDGTVNSQANPAKAGSYISIWATGTGYFPGSDGQIATGANQFCGLVGYCEVFVGGSQLNVLYAGAAPGMVNGVVQINFQVTSAMGGYYLSVDGINSDIFAVYTTQ
jgi:uncharacterized protein (TIGR03437 family)